MNPIGKHNGLLTLILKLFDLELAYPFSVLLPGYFRLQPVLLIPYNMVLSINIAVEIYNIRLTPVYSY